MNEQFRNQSRILKFLFICYLLPLIAIIFYANQFVPSSKTWILLPTGLLVSVVGALVLFILLRKWESHLVEALSSIAPITPSEEEIPKPFVGRVEAPIAPPKEQAENPQFHEELESQKSQIESLRHDLDLKQQEIHKFSKDNERYQRQAELVLQEFAQYKKAAQEQIEQKGSLLADYQQTMSEQKAVIEKKQHQIAQLETKVHDLTYEIKTLLQLAEIGNAPEEHKHKPAHMETPQQAHEDIPVMPENQIRSIEDAVVQLKRCVDIAQKITGSNQFTSPSSPRMIGDDYFAIDYRRLFDNLRSENGATVFFYSQKENKMLFVNNQCRNLLGWTPEKFIQNFSDIVQQHDEWKNSLSQLTIHPETRLSMIMKSKSGQDVLVQGVLGSIPTGLFKHHVIGVLY